MPTQKITLEKAAQAKQQGRVTILLNKPMGYVSGQAEEGHKPAILLIEAATRWEQDKSPQKFFPQPDARPRPCRSPRHRLDRIAGAHPGRPHRKQLIGEDSPIEKEYLVRVQGKLVGNGLNLLNHGLSLDGKKLKPAKVSWLNDDQLRFTLNEGKKRQIRRMCELVGLKVTALKRVRIGKVKLGDLPVGQWRYLGEDEKF